MVKIAVVGGSEFTVGFQLAGIKDIIETGKNPFDGIKSLKSRKDIGIAIIDEKIMENLQMHERSEIENSIEPVFIPISSKIEQDSLKRLIKKSIGVDLWK